MYIIVSTIIVKFYYSNTSTTRNMATDDVVAYNFDRGYNFRSDLGTFKETFEALRSLELEVDAMSALKKRSIGERSTRSTQRARNQGKHKKKPTQRKKTRARNGRSYGRSKDTKYSIRALYGAGFNGKKSKHKSRSWFRVPKTPTVFCCDLGMTYDNTSVRIRDRISKGQTVSHSEAHAESTPSPTRPEATNAKAKDAKTTTSQQLELCHAQERLERAKKSALEARESLCEVLALTKRKCDEAIGMGIGAAVIQEAPWCARTRTRTSG